MHVGRLHYLIAAALLFGVLGADGAQAGPLAVIGNYTDPGPTAQPPWPPGTVTILDTATDKTVGSPLTVGVNPQAVAISPDDKTAVVACSQSSDLWFIDLTANPPKVTDHVSLGTGTGDTFYPESVSISPDSQFVAVAPLAQAASADGTSIQHFTATRYIDIVSMTDHSVNKVDLQSDQLLDENGNPFAGAAEAVAISGKGAIVVISPSTKVGTSTGEIYALPYANGDIVFPGTSDGQQVGVVGQTGFNIALSPDGSTGIIPLWRDASDKKGYFDVVSIDDSGKLVITANAQGGPTITQEKVDAGGSGTHSVAFSPDGTKVYVRNLISPGNIAVFGINPDHTVTDTKLRLNADGIPDSVWQLAQGLLGGVLGGLLGGGNQNTDPQAAGGYVGSEMIAVTPDGRKVYAVNPFAGTPDPIFSLLGIDGYGDGELQVFNADQPAAIATLMGGSQGPIGKNPIAIAIQHQ